MLLTRNIITGKLRQLTCRYELVKRKAKGWLYPRAPLGVMSVTVGQHVPLPLLWVPFIRWKIIGNGIEIGDKTFCAAEDKVGKSARHKLICNIGFLSLGISYDVTIVPWETKPRSLIFNKQPGRYTILGCFDDKVFFTDETSLYSSSNCFRSREFIANIEWKQTYRSDRSLLLNSPAGWFLRTDGGVIHSNDLKSWSVAVEIGSRGMFQHLDFIYDHEESKTYVFAAEYSTDPERRHGIFRGEYGKDGTIRWTKCFEFYSSKEGKASGEYLPSARHIHVLSIDKKTGWLWVATGDSDRESGIFVSKDNGKTFEVFTAGSQEYRTLMLLFTEDYLYWNMDTHTQDQKVFRVPRLQLDSLLRPLSQLNDILQSDGEEMAACKEIVANLPYGAQWYGVIVKNSKGEDELLMSASPESQVPETGEQPHRDWNARIFAIKELNSGKPLVSEVCCAPPLPTLKGKARRYCRVDPRCQDEHGNIYFMGQNSLLSGALIGRLY